MRSVGHWCGLPHSRTQMAFPFRALCCVCFAASATARDRADRPHLMNLPGSCREAKRAIPTLVVTRILYQTSDLYQTSVPNFAKNELARACGFIPPPHRRVPRIAATATSISATAPSGVPFHLVRHALGGPVCGSVDEISLESISHVLLCIPKLSPSRLLLGHHHSRAPIPCCHRTAVPVAAAPTCATRARTRAPLLVSMALGWPHKGPGTCARVVR